MVESLKPMKDKIIVKIRDGERKLSSGLIIIDRPFDFKPANRNDIGTRATVIAVGPWQDEISPGDEVIVEKFGGIEFTIQGEEFVMLESHEVLAVVESESVEWIGKSIFGGN